MLVKMQAAMTRRDFVKSSAVALAASVAPPLPLAAAPTGKKMIGLQVGDSKTRPPRLVRPTGVSPRSVA